MGAQVAINSKPKFEMRAQVATSSQIMTMMRLPLPFPLPFPVRATRASQFDVDVDIQWQQHNSIDFVSTQMTRRNQIMLINSSSNKI